MLNHNTASLDHDPYRSSRNRFIVEVVCASIIGSLASGFFLSGYFEYIGMSQALNGIVTALPVITTIFQPVGVLLARRFGKPKSSVVCFAIIHRVAYSLLYAIPLLLSTKLWVPAVIVTFAVANITGAMITPLATDWLMSITPKEVRASYFGAREISLVLVSAVSSLLMGLCMNYFANTGYLGTSYMVLAAIITIFGITNILFLTSVKAPPEKLAERVGKSEITAPFQDKSFRNIILAVCIYTFGANLSAPFWSVHQLTNLQLSYRYLTILATVSMLIRVLILRGWMKLSRPLPWSSLFVFSLLSIAFSHFMNIFVTAGNAVWLQPVTAFFGLPGWACVSIAVLNMQYDNISLADTALSIGVLSVISGISGFLATLIGGAIVSATERLAPVFSGGVVYGQQVQMAVSAIIIACSAIYTASLKQREKIT